MQIFRLDNDPIQCAKYHADFHVNKLLLEATQLLNTMLNEDGHDKYAFYGSTHINHPCQLWLHESGGNIKWTLNLIAGLQYEKDYRWSSGTHTSYEKLLDNWFEDDECILPYDMQESQTAPAIACGDLTDADLSPVEQYRQYYREVKQELDGFGYDNGRDKPDWL